MKKCLLLLLLLSPALRAAEPPGQFKLYGDISNFASWNSREGMKDGIGLFYLLPADIQPNAVGMDLNDASAVRFVSIASRIGLTWGGYKFRNIDLKARMEADFYCANGVKSVLRLRHAWFSASTELSGKRTLRILAGQTWHPFSADLPHTLSLSCGAPFNVYNYSPQVSLTYDIFPWMKLSASAMWHTNFCSTGPNGSSSQYIEWGGIPECYVGLHFTCQGFKAKIGGNFLSIKPRLQGTYPWTDVPVLVGDKLDNWSFFAFAEFRKGDFSIKGKSLFTQSGEHLNLMGGYALHSTACDRDGNPNGTYIYTPYRTLSSWVSFGYGRKLQASLFLGYLRNLGTMQALLNTNASCIFYNNSAYNLVQAGRIAPVLKYRIGRLLLGIEYELTGAQYGDKATLNPQNGLAENDLRVVASHRVTALAACIF